MVEVPGLVVEFGLGEGVAFPNGDRCQRDTIGHVADSPDARDIRLRPFIHNDSAIIVKRYTGRFTAEPVRIRVSSNGHHDDVRLQVVTILELDMKRKLAVSLFDFLEHCLRNDAHASLFQTFMHCHANVFIKPAQHCIAAIDEACLHAQPGEDVSELYGDIAAARDDEVFGQGFEMEDLVRGDGVLDARQLLSRRHPRTATNGNQDLAGRHRRSAGLQAQRVGIDKFRALFDDFNARIHKVSVIDAGQAVDFGMHRCREDLVVVGHLADAPAIPLGMLDVLSVAAGIDHELLRHAATDDARATHPVFLRHCDFGP